MPKRDNPDNAIVTALPGTMSIRPPNVGRRGGCPYEALGPFGAFYASPMREIHTAGLAAQRQGELTSERRQAWKELRRVESRIVADAAWIELVPEDANVPIAPPKLELPEPPPPTQEMLLEAMKVIPEPDIPPYELSPCPLITCDRWALAKELIRDFLKPQDDSEEMPSFMEEGL